MARALLIRTRRNRYPAGTPPVPERYFEAAAGLGVTPDGGPPEFFLSPAAMGEVDGFLAESGLDPSRGLVALAPGAAHATKRWPVEHWKALAASLSGARAADGGRRRTGGRRDRRRGGQGGARAPCRWRGASACRAPARC